MSRKKDPDIVIDDAPLPPMAPDVGRGLGMSWAQGLTLFVLIAIVISALAGAYNEHQRETHTNLPGLDVRVKYTTRFRFQQTDIVSVMIRNTTSNVIDSVRVSVDTAYMAGFAEVEMIPEPLFPFVAQLNSIPAGEAREVRVEARGVKSGTHRGEVLVISRADTARVRISTTVLP